ncbi:homeobox protein NANOG isoform X2 [Conger conger]|uniref:homeobox protein NANOG isoform X2 n=1 Tax=Conger conger TaxID=82655 RepID=UPI002A5A491B|nr:homeobox protein NANOG isoform X2 [Conger conger]
MADWKLPVSYNYNPSYHAYAYGLMYPQGPEQNHQNLGWAEAYNHQGVSGGYYTPPPQQQHQSPHRNLEDGHATSAHFPGSVLYFADSHTQNGRLFLSHNRAQTSQRSTEIEQASSDTPSDSEAHTPDSWSSGSSRELAPQAPTSSWREGEEEDVESGSPDSSGHVSSTLTIKEEEPLRVGVEREEQPPLPMTTPQSVPAPPRKAKARTAFSEDQMTALTHRFSVQRYLTPVEMKTLAGLTGLTYKQVKTWFQNRRMKLKRHQKDTSWVSERYSDPTYRNIPSHTPMDTSALAQEHYANPQFREAVFKKSPPQTPTYYQNYPRPQSPHQPATRAHGGWNLPPATHFEFNSNNYNNANNSINSDDGTAVDAIESPTRMVMVQGAAQWST